MSGTSSVRAEQCSARVEHCSTPTERAWAVLETVPDPEIPVLSVLDLGIVRDVREGPGGGLEVVLTPTYSGCPATEVIQRDVKFALEDAGLGPVTLVVQRAPAWTTDWISEAGRQKLLAYGIAPPAPLLERGSTDPLLTSRSQTEDAALKSRAPSCPISTILANLPVSVACPRCTSENTERLAQFGSTPCKALYRCLDCREPFDYFKPI